MQFFYQQKVFAGVPLQLPYGGLYFVLASAGVARKVGIQFASDGQNSRVMPDMTTGFSLPVKFDGITFYSDTDTIVSFFASPTPVTLGVQDGGIVTIPGGVRVNSTVGDPVHVDIVTPITLTATAVQVNNTDAQAVPVVQKIGTVFTTHIDNLDAAAVPVRAQALATFVHPVAVSVGVAATALVSDATLRKLLIRNDHATAKIALGGAGVTLANGAIVLLPGDIWTEDAAAGAAWYAISDTAATNVQVMGIK